MPLQSDNQKELLTLEEWRGLNQQFRRASIDQNEEWWNENLFALGKGNIRSCWGPSAPIYTAPSGYTIRRIFFGYTGCPPTPTQPPPGRLGWMFLDNGTAKGLVDQVDLDTHQVKSLGQIWQPVAPKYWGDVKVWRPSFYGQVAGQVGGAVIGSPQGLYATDGCGNLWSPGDLAPDWLTDQAETGESPITGPTVMPVGLPGIYTMEVYNARLWVAGKDVISFSAPSNGADFSTINGGGSFGYFGNKLTYTWMDLAASAGYLYCFGDSSTDVISNVQMVGSGTPTDPYLTNFTYSNVDPQVGQRFPRWVGRLGRFFTMFNGAGIFFMAGSDAEMIGQKTANVYFTLDTSLYYPTMAPATMFGFRVMLCNGRFTDPFGVTRNLLLMWHPTPEGSAFWSVASQFKPPPTASGLPEQIELTHIGFYEDNSVITPYGTDGTFLYQLFAQPNPLMPKRLSTQALRGTGTAQLAIKNWSRTYMELHDNNGGGVSFTGTVTCAPASANPGGAQDVAFELTAGQRYSIEPWPISCAGINAAIDLTSVSPDFTIERLHILAEQRSFFGA